jgi:hypothetical protein
MQETYSKEVEEKDYLNSSQEAWKWPKRARGDDIICIASN